MKYFFELISITINAFHYNIVFSRANERVEAFLCKLVLYEMDIPSFSKSGQTKRAEASLVRLLCRLIFRNKK